MQSKNVQILNKSTSAAIPNDTVGKNLPVLNRPVMKHDLSTLAIPPLREKSDTRANKPLCINYVVVTPLTANKMLKPLDIQTDTSYIVSRNDFEILEIVKSKGFTKESLSRLSNVREIFPEQQINEAENLSLPKNINNTINEKSIKNMLSPSELNKTLTKCYEAASSTSRKESVRDYSKTNNMSVIKYSKKYSHINDASGTDIPTDLSLQGGRNKSAQLLTLLEKEITREQASPRVQILPTVQAVTDENINAQELPQNTQQKQFPEQNTQQTPYIQHNTEQYQYPRLIIDRAHRDSPPCKIIEHQIVQKQYQQFPSNVLPANNYAQYYQHNLNLQMSGAMHQQSYVNTWNTITDIPRGAIATAQQTAAANIVAPTYQESYQHQGLPKMPSRRGRKPRGAATRAASRAATRTAPHQRQFTQDQVNQYNSMMQQRKILEIEQQQRHWESQLLNYPNSSWSQAHAFKRPQ